MTRTEILEQVRAMVNRTFLYREETHTILSVEEAKDIYTIKTNRGVIKKGNDQMPAFIDLLLNNEVDLQLPTAPSHTVTVTQLKGKRVISALESKISEENEKIFSTLDELIEMVKNDASKIPQAVAINDLVKTRIDARKVEVLASKI